MSTRRSFFGKVFGGALAAVGLKAAEPLRFRSDAFSSLDFTENAWRAGVPSLKMGDRVTFAGARYVINSEVTSSGFTMTPDWNTGERITITPGRGSAVNF